MTEQNTPLILSSLTKQNSYIDSDTHRPTRIPVFAHYATKKHNWQKKIVSIVDVIYCRNHLCERCSKILRRKNVRIVFAEQAHIFGREIYVLYVFYSTSLFNCCTKQNLSTTFN